MATHCRLVCKPTVGSNATLCKCKRVFFLFLQAHMLVLQCEVPAPLIVVLAKHSQHNIAGCNIVIIFQSDHSTVLNNVLVCRTSRQSAVDCRPVPICPAFLPRLHHLCWRLLHFRASPIDSCSLAFTSIKVIAFFTVSTTSPVHFPFAGRMFIKQSHQLDHDHGTNGSS